MVGRKLLANPLLLSFFKEPFGGAVPERLVSIWGEQKEEDDKLCMKGQVLQSVSTWKK
jgi:hypothetical protein